MEIGREDEKDIIKVKIKSYEKIDLSLRKYVSAVSTDAIFEQKEYIEREPKVELNDLEDNTKTTAKYLGSKIPVAVRPNDYVLFKIRIYNEGIKPAIASKIVDYLPEGTEFVQELEKNKIWTFDSNTNTISTNDNYVAKLIEGHTEGKELDYQDLEVVLKVNNNVPENIKMVNIAEIVESKFANGLIAVDKDNEKSFVYPKDITKYYGGEDNDKSDNYIPGQEDDDDFDAIVVNTLYGKYTLEIQTTNKSGNIINNLETIFEVNEIYEPTKEGKVSIKNVEINKQNLNSQDVYKVIELKPPTGYKELEGTIIITVNKKESADRTRYEPYNIIVELEKTNGQKTKLNNAEVKIQNGETKVIVKIANEQKEQEQNIPNNTGNNISQSGNNTIVIGSESTQNGSSANSTKITSNNGNKTITVRTNNGNNTNNTLKSNGTSVSKTNTSAAPKTGDDIPEIMFNIIYIVISINIIEVAIERKFRE